MKIIDGFDWRIYEGDLSKIESVDGWVYLDYCESDLPNLKTIGGIVWLEYYDKELPKLESIYDREFKPNQIVSL